MFLPYSTESLVTRWPLGNIGIIAACTLVSALMMFGIMPESLINLMILDGWAPAGLIGHLFLHADFFHFFFNMLYLWVFGNAVCETTGNLRYCAMYLAAGLLAASVHNLFDGSPAVGASGAINGIIGFYLILFPTNKISCCYWILFKLGVVEVTGYWLILFWFVLDAWGALSGVDAGIAYWAHVGGLLGGIALGVLFEMKGWAKLSRHDNPSLIDLWFRKDTREPISRRIKTREELIREFREREEAAKQEKASEAACPHCEANLEIPVDLIGTTIKCPSCGGQIALE